MNSKQQKKHEADFPSNLETFEGNAAAIVSKLEQRKIEDKPTVEKCSQSILIAMGALAKRVNDRDDRNGQIRAIMGDLLANTVAMAYVSNGIAARAYELTAGTVLPFGGAFTGLMQSTFCQYRVHAASYDLEKMLQGENPISQEWFEKLSHERAESLANLYKALRTFAMEFDLDLESCLSHGLKRMNNGIGVIA